MIESFTAPWDAKLLHVVVHLYWRDLALTCGALNSEGGLMLAAQTDEHCDDMLTWRHVCDPLLSFGVPWSSTAHGHAFQLHLRLQRAC